MKLHQPNRPRGFTLVELLVVILIIGVVSAVTLPTVLPALAHRQVSESARILQAAIEGARDAAIRANAPRGIRLLPDPAFPFSAAVPMLASNRIISIEPAGEYTEGRVAIRGLPTAAPSFGGGKALRIEECQTGAVVNPRTSWYWNIRVGDKIRIGGTGRAYTIVGPMVVGPATDSNPELFVNVGDPGATVTNPNETGSEYLFLVNGEDDDRDGFTDEGYDGLNNDIDLPNPLVDEDDEWETEAWLGGEDTFVSAVPARTRTFDASYTILRRPYPTPGVKPVDLPSNVVIDLTTFNQPEQQQERSRLPVDVNSGYVDIMIAPNGTVIPTTIYSSPAKFTTPFYHFWLAERTDVFPAVVTAGVTYRLPMPEGTPGYPAAGDTSSRFLKGDRRLVTLFARTGQVVTNEVESFDGSAVSKPFYDAQMGTREAK